MRAFDDERDITLALDGWDMNARHGATQWLLSLSGVSGLWDGRASNLSTSQLAMIDGLAWNVPRYGGKTVDLTGYVLGACPADILAAWKTFKGMVAAADQVHTLSYAYAGGRMFAADVLRDSTAPTLKMQGMTVATFTVSLVMPSGRALATDSESITVSYRRALAGGFRFPILFNDLAFSDVQYPVASEVLPVGDAGAEWAATFHGPLSGPFGLAVDGFPDYWVFDATLGASDVLEVDSRDRSIKLNGQANAALVPVTSYAWWTLHGPDMFRLLSSSWTDGGYCVVEAWDYD